MALVETPDRIMSTGGGGGESKDIWMLLLAFLFMFRGGGWGGEGRRDGDRDRDDHYRRDDAHYEHLNRNEWDLQKEGLIGRYEARLQGEHCCCETNQHIERVACEVKEQGGLTRAHETDLYMKGEIERKNEEIATLRARLNRRETVDETLAGVSRMLDERLGGRWGRGGCCNERPVMAYDEPIKYVPDGRRREDRHDEDFFRFESA